MEHIVKIVRHKDGKDSDKEVVDVSILVSRTDYNGEWDMRSLENILAKELRENKEIIKEHPDAKIEYSRKDNDFSV